jgi:RimJ/RimL family protein N-acetyltransferase
MVKHNDLELVECSQKYWEFVRTLRSDPRVSQFFVEQAEITAEMQVKYMESHAKFYRICLLRTQPVGYIGAVDGDLRICTHPDFQKTGVASFMLKEALDLFPDVTAKVKIGNTASLKALQKAGFRIKYLLLERS